MKILLDTNAFLRWVEDDPALSAKARSAIANTNNEVLVSLVVPWELAIKSALGKIRLAHPAGQFVARHAAANGFSLLPIDLADVALVETLPMRHRDPFDRLLIAQAKNRKLAIATADAIFSTYNIKRIW